MIRTFQAKTFSGFHELWAMLCILHSSISDKTGPRHAECLVNRLPTKQSAPKRGDARVHPPGFNKHVGQARRTHLHDIIPTSTNGAYIKVLRRQKNTTKRALIRTPLDPPTALPYINDESEMLKRRTSRRPFIR